MAGTTLINCFEVPDGRDEEFLAAWQAVADYLAEQPGYRSTRLHQALDGQARFRFVNVAEWESPERFRAAIATDGFRERAAALADFPASPGLYQLVREHDA